MLSVLFFAALRQPPEERSHGRGADGLALCFYSLRWEVSVGTISPPLRVSVPKMNPHFHYSHPVHLSRILVVHKGQTDEGTQCNL